MWCVVNSGQDNLQFPTIIEKKVYCGGQFDSGDSNFPFAVGYKRSLTSQIFWVIDSFPLNLCNANEFDIILIDNLREICFPKVIMNDYNQYLTLSTYSVQADY